MAVPSSKSSSRSYRASWAPKSKPFVSQIVSPSNNKSAVKSVRGRCSLATRSNTRKSTSSSSQDATNSIPSSISPTRMDAIEILEENCTKYRISWAGVNPKTCEPWESTWEPKRKTSKDLIQAWERTKPSGQQPKSSRKGTRTPPTKIVRSPIGRRNEIRLKRKASQDSCEQLSPTLDVHERPKKRVRSVRSEGHIKQSEKGDPSTASDKQPKPLNPQITKLSSSRLTPSSEQPDIIYIETQSKVSSNFPSSSSRLSPPSYPRQLYRALHQTAPSSCPSFKKSLAISNLGFKKDDINLANTPDSSLKRSHQELQETLDSETPLNHSHFPVVTSKTVPKSFIYKRRRMEGVIQGTSSQPQVISITTPSTLTGKTVTNEREVTPTETTSTPTTTHHLPSSKFFRYFRQKSRPTTSTSESFIDQGPSDLPLMRACLDPSLISLPRFFASGT